MEAKLLGALAVVLLAALPAVPASAGPIPDGSDLGVPLPPIPCLHVTVQPAGGAGPSVSVDAPDHGCQEPGVRLDLRTSATGSAGSLSLELRGGGGGGLGGLRDRHRPPHLMMGTEDPVLVPRFLPDVGSLFLQSQSNSQGPVEPAPSAPSVPPAPDVTVEARAAFRIAWKPGSCEVADATWEAWVGGRPVPSELPSGVQHGLCALGAAPAPDAVAPAAAAIVLAGLAEIQRADPVIEVLLEPLLAGLRGGEVPMTTVADRPSPGFAVGGPLRPEIDLGAGAPGAGAGGEAVAAGAPLDRSLHVGAQADASTPLAAATVRAGEGLDQQTVGARGRDGLALAGEATSRAGPGVSGAVVAPWPTQAGPATYVTLDPSGPIPSGGSGAAFGTHAAGALALAPVLSPERALAVAGAGALLLLAIAILYQRIQQPAALQHPIRQALYTACVERVGGTSGELAREVGAGRKTAEYHLRYLVRLGLLRVDATPRGRRYAPHTAPKPSEQAPMEGKVLEGLAARPGISTSALAASLGLPRARVDRCVKGLLQSGRLVNRVEHNQRVLFLPEAPGASQVPDPTAVLQGA